MKRVRLVSLAAAIVVTAVQWAAFFSPMLYTGSVRLAGAQTFPWSATSAEVP
jgi:hypothetical protein